MDKAEELAAEYLKSCGFSSIVHEPDGNVPPDFACDGGIAVEVRRLNQSFHDGDARRGLAEVEIPLLQHIRNLLPSFGPPLDGQSWFVFYHFSRPFPKWKVLKPKVVRELQDFIAHPTPFKKYLSPEFQLELIAASKVHKDYFMMGGYVDEQSGGWVVGEMLENLKHGIVEKQRKVAPYRQQYPTWWLVFIDLIAYGMDSHDHKSIREQLHVDHEFDRIVILDPNNPKRFFEI